MGYVMSLKDEKDRLLRRYELIKGSILALSICSGTLLAAQVGIFTFLKLGGDIAVTATSVSAPALAVAGGLFVGGSIGYLWGKCVEYPLKKFANFCVEGYKEFDESLKSLKSKEVKFQNTNVPQKEIPQREVFQQREIPQHKTINEVSSEFNKKKTYKSIKDLPPADPVTIFEEYGV